MTTNSLTIALRYLDIDATPARRPSREEKIAALSSLGINVPPHLSPLTAWLMAMSNENGLSAHADKAHALIAYVAATLCPHWQDWLAHNRPDWDIFA
ncbi:MAG: hypothetical protein R3E79_23935 [Caldilineaceae bacterium]